jgi:undecaprenyl-diphosphatase
MTANAPAPSATTSVVRPSVESAAGVAIQPGLAGEVVSGLLARIVALDARMVALIVDLRHPILTKLMASVTGLGSASAAAVFLGLCYLAGWRRELAVAAISLSITGVVVVSLMGLVQRAFPPQPVCMTDGSGVTPHSFPSGHAAAVTVYAAVSRRSERLPSEIVAALAATIAFSRIYLGTHFLSDTVVGVLIGGAAVLVSRRLLDDWTGSLPLRRGVGPSE